MTKPTWLIENGFDENDCALIEAAVAAHCRVAEGRYVPFAKQFRLSADPDASWTRAVTDGGPILFHGSLNALRAVRGPLVTTWCDFAKLRCSSYYNWFGADLLGSRYVMLPLREVLRRRDDLYRFLGYFFHDTGDGSTRDDRRVFIRPDENDKRFDGQVVHYEQLDGWMASVFGRENEVDGLCVVSSVEPIDAEYRLVVAEGKVIASSRYRLDGRLSIERGCPDGAVALVERLARIWEPHPIWIADVAQQREHNIRGNPPDDFRPDRFKLIEIGSVNCAGFYACDLKPIVEKMTELAVSATAR